ncbi:MAG: nucleoside-diphosphate sugar epimerase/dehydratase [Candidatus Devosia phytovorans]|uniref:Nucleoside-diphosphate sugar epimerase/dehydratase n=1 Tax=Candidatus Devosia phytovorans TaxID=3121372 RepID=A0AAJ5VS30_9HYPH|nr:nucleoside-diphosphate sugar epimerase/dehydratase [Devosia sp.]WEK03776.1 MAG: nucleoside-diphosphate sugar epimerase/dehydratase [Devosia sp.]
MPVVPGRLAVVLLVPKSISPAFSALQQRFGMTKVITMLTGLPRFWKRVIIIVFDALALAAALWASFALRYGLWTPPATLYDFLLILTAPIVAIPIFVRLGLYRAVIRYLPERALWTTLQATTLATLCWILVIFLSQITLSVVVPRSVPILYWALATIAIGGSRFIAKKLLWPASANREHNKAIAIYGAGEAGAQLANALRRQGNYRIVAFLDDNRTLHGRDVTSIRVFPPSAVGMLTEQYGLEEVILSIPTLNAARRREIVTSVGRQGIKIRTVPPVTDIMDGRYLVSQIREIDIDELLGRSSVPPAPHLLQSMVEGKTIMVTGAGGSIGSELCRLIVKLSPKSLILFEANEFALYNIERELGAVPPMVVPILGSIVDQQRVQTTMQRYAPDVVFHAAAHKHVPLIEANALEGMRNNILGTRNVVDLAYRQGVSTFVLISSDKAVRPTNVMGATKRWAELIVAQKAAEAAEAGTGQRFTAVRFGNVLGSNGSVVPLFKEQIAKGGPVTLTDPTMTRYFMSIHEASELIVQAGALSQGGDIFLLDMDKPILIKDLAENMVQLAGLTVRSPENSDGDIEILVTGKRPGEKMFEELFYDDNAVETTDHPKIRRSPKESPVPIDEAFAQLMEWVDGQDEQKARQCLFGLIEERPPV